MDFKVKQEVTVIQYGIPIRISIVTKIDKRKMTLIDGTQWYVDGSKEWGMGSVRFYRGAMVRPRADKDENVRHTSQQAAG